MARKGEARIGCLGNRMQIEHVLASLHHLPALRAFFRPFALAEVGDPAIKKSSSLFPDLTVAANHRGFNPRRRSVMLRGPGDRAALNSVGNCPREAFASGDDHCA
jgi:hypothetical protein